MNRATSNRLKPRLAGTAVALAVLIFLGTPSSAQTNATRNLPGRYLFIVDTSAAMRQRSSVAQRAVSNLLLSSMHAQFQRGDTVGVWTYNEQLYAGHLPLQRWSPQNEQVVATNILMFLKRQPYEKKPHFDRVWPALQRVIRESYQLTVLLISSGEEQISGTPFDREINHFFQTQSREQKKARAPFVIVLRTRRGEFTGVTLNAAQWPVEFPPLPPEPKVADAPKPKPPEPKPAPRPAAPPLIIIGKKSEAPPESATTPPSANLKPTTSEAVPSAASSTAQTDPTTVPSAASIATKLDTELKPSVAESPRTPPGEVAPKKTPQSSQQPLEFSSSTAKPPAATAASTAEPKPVLPPAVAPSATSVPEPTPSPSLSATTTTSPQTDEAKPESSATAAAAPGAATPPVEVAMATRSEMAFRVATLLLSGAVVLLCGALLLLLRRRARTHASLITRSMDQGRK
jgi:hypothetical protein